ncbi:MAG: MFS transporter, partial [Pseudomonadota bacterium]
MFLLLGVYWPFFPALVEERTGSAAAVGILMTVFFWARLIWPPTFAFVTRHDPRPGRPMIIMGLAFAITFIFFLGDFGIWSVALLTLLASATIHSVLPLGEARASRFARYGYFDYGSVRLWGSVAFILANLLGGAVFERFGADGIVYWISGSACLLVLAILL